MGLLKIGWRNIWRNRRRTLINMSAVSFGLFLLLFFIGLMGSYLDDAQNDLALSGIGHVELYAPGYRDEHDPGKAIAQPEAVVKAVEAAVPEGSRVGWRLLGDGLLSSAWGSRSVRLLGVVPDRESAMSKAFGDIAQGESLEPGDERGILVGEKLAENLGLKVGSKVRLMVQRADKEMGVNLLRVRGIFHAISPLASEGQVYVTPAAARTLMGVGDVAHQVLVQLPRSDDAEEVTAALKTKLGAEVEVLSFRELQPELKVLLDTMDKMLGVFTFAIFFLVALGILNTWLMGVLERTREFGLMSALGTRKRRILAIVLSESFWVSSISVVIGLAAGAFFCWAAAKYEFIDWRHLAGDGFDMGGASVSMLIKPVLTPAQTVRTGIIVWTITMIAGLYPAWRAAKMQPADALRE